MATCPGSGGSGTTEFKDGWEDWWVICPACGARWAGGSASDLPTHETQALSDESPSDDQESIDATSDDQFRDVRRRSQGVAEHLATMLSFLGITEQDESAIAIEEQGWVAVKPDAAWQLYEKLTDLVPACWTASVWYGHPAPDGCTMPTGLCARCRHEGRRRPGRDRPVPPCEGHPVL